MDVAKRNPEWSDFYDDVIVNWKKCGEVKSNCLEGMIFSNPLFQGQDIKVIVNDTPVYLGSITEQPTHYPKQPGREAVSVIICEREEYDHRIEKYIEAYGNC